MKNQQTNDMTKILSFLTNLYVVHKQSFHSGNLAEMIEGFLKRNGLSAKLMYELIESPVQRIHYNPSINTIFIRAIQTSPKHVLRNVNVNANIIDLLSYKIACQLPLHCPVFTNLKEIRQFINKSVEQISDILMYDNQKFFICTNTYGGIEFSNPATTKVAEKPQTTADKPETKLDREERLLMSNPADMQRSEVFVKFEDKPCKKLLFTDFDGILSSEYIRSSNGSISKTINYGNKTAVQLAHEMGYRVICITASNNTESLQISKDVCKDCKFDAFYVVSNPELKLGVIQSLAMEYDISLEKCIYIGDDFYDSEIFPEIGKSFAPVTSKELLMNKPGVWLHTNQPFLEAVKYIQWTVVD